MVFHRGSCCYVKQIDDKLDMQIIDGTPGVTADVVEEWYRFFNFEDDWCPDEKMYTKWPWLREVWTAASGLRLLRQDPWDCLMAFIVSQRNSIARITECVDGIASAAGDYGYEGHYYLPRPEAVKPRCLYNCKLGYREKYLYSAADMVTTGQVDLNGIKFPARSLQRARQELLRIHGVGAKVADCVLLFSLDHGEAWPIDVWIEKAMAEVGLSTSDTAKFGSHAGLIQERLYWWIMNKANAE